MRLAEAARLCPQAVFRRGDAQAANRMREETARVLLRYSPKVEIASIGQSSVEAMLSYLVERATHKLRPPEEPATSRPESSIKVGKMSTFSTGQLTTKLTSRPGTTITLRTVVPSKRSATAWRAKASRSSLLASWGASMRPRNLPITCTANSKVSLPR